MAPLRRTILLVAPFAPVRDARHGGARTIFGLASALVERHDLVLLHLEVGQPVDPRLAGRCAAVVEFALRPPARWRDAAALAQGRSLWAGRLGIRRLQRVVATLSREWAPDVVQAEYGVLGEALAGAPQHALRIATIYDPAASWRESLPLQREGLPLTHRLDAYVAVREERRVLRLVDCAVVFTERDRALLKRLAPDARLTTIPLGCDVPATALDSAGTDPTLLLFVGNFVHPPNVDAAVALAARILPRVRERHPAARLEIVGPSPPSEVRALAGDAVRVTGAVPTVAPYLNRAAVVVAPIAIGGGMRVKVLEALAAGKAVVASTRAAEGLTARAGEHLLVVDGDAPAADAIAGLLDDEDARRRMAGRARAWALQALSWSAMADRYDELYASLDRGRGGRRAETMCS